MPALLQKLKAIFRC